MDKNACYQVDQKIDNLEHVSTMPIHSIPFGVPALIIQSRHYQVDRNTGAHGQKADYHEGH